MRRGKVDGHRHRLEIKMKLRIKAEAEREREMPVNGGRQESSGSGESIQKIVELKRVGRPWYMRAVYEWK